ncbi:unnamed protein product, partial [Ilex paraguariensis]
YASDPVSQFSEVLGRMGTDSLNNLQHLLALMDLEASPNIQHIGLPSSRSLALAYALTVVDPVCRMGTGIPVEDH